MTKIWIIASKEFKAAFKDKMFLVITVLFLLLSILSVYIGSSTKHAELQAYSRVVQMLKSTGTNSFPQKPQIYPLAILHNIIKYIGLVGAILAVFLGFSSFSEEKELGTIKLLLSRPLYRDQLLSGKLLGGGMVIALLLMITFLFNIYLFTQVAGITPDVNEINKLFMFIVFAFFYMMSFYTATLLVSIKSNDSSFAFLLMLIVWVGIAFVIPQLADSQKAYINVLNNISLSLDRLPTETVISRIIEVFSPTVQFQNVGRDLLQTVNRTAEFSLGRIIKINLLPIIYMLTPGILTLFIAYTTFLKDGKK